MSNWGKRARRAIAIAGAAVATLLSACGGGTEQITPFEPTRYIAFGDEASVLTAQAPLGRKYTVNAVGSDGVTPGCAINTTAQPSLLWTQITGLNHGFVFAECNPTNLPVGAFNFAAPGAKADDFPAQLAAAGVVHGSFGCNDLMTVMVGTNDVIEQFENVYLANPTPATADTVVNEMRARGVRLGQAIGALTDNGANIIVSTIQLTGQTPYARQQAASHPNANVVDVLNRSARAFNEAVRSTIPNDGSRWGLIELDAMVSAAIREPRNYGLENITDAVCAAATPDCENNAADLVSGGNPITWLWASDRLIGWAMHSRLGSFARLRAQDNPFGCG